MQARRAVVAEAWEIVRILLEPWLWLLVVAMALCGSLAYLRPYDVALDIGGSPQACSAYAVFDTPYVAGFNADPEFDGQPGSCATQTVAYRWAFEDATIHIPGIGRAAYNVELGLTSGQPSGQRVFSAWTLNNTSGLNVPIWPEPRSYHLFAPPSGSPDLALRFLTPPYQPPGDPRALAFAVDRVRITSLGRIVPDWSQVVTLSAIIALGYVLARRWSLAPLLATAAAVLSIGVFVALLVWQRQGLTIFSVRILVLMLAGYGLVVALEPLAYRAAQALRVVLSQTEARVIVALVVVGWLVRALGLFHPQTFSSDVGLHINNLLDVTRGELIFSEGLPAEAGGGDAPYPPTQYIMLLPWQLLGLHERILVTAATSLVDSLTIFWVWLVLRVIGAPASAAYAAGGLYLFATPLLRSLSTGEMTNVWGQALVMPWLLVVLLWRQRRVQGVVLGTVTAIALLGHFGVFLSLGILLVTLGAIWIVRRDQHIWRFALIVSLAGAAVIGSYYLTFLDVIGQARSSVPATTTRLERLSLEVQEFVRLNGQIGLLHTGIGLAGVVLAWRKCRVLGAVLAAWWLSSLLSWGTLLVTQQALRWEAFLFPALVLGGGLALAELWSQRTTLRWTSPLLLSVTIAQGAALWVQRLITYR